MATVLHNYTLEMFNDDGAQLGDVPVDMDWEPAIEWTQFEGIRQGKLPPVSVMGESEVTPVWTEDEGEPYVNGVRVTVSAPENGAQMSCEIPQSYFKAPAQSASQQLVKDGVLKEGETFRFKVCAFSAATHPVPAKQADTAHSFVVRQKSQPLPILEKKMAPFKQRASISQGEKHDEGDIPIYIERNILDEAAAQARKAGANETGGILIGHLCSDPETRELFLEVTAQVPADHTVATSTKLTFTPAAWSSVAAAIELRKRDEIWLGWHHSHPVAEWCKNCPPERQRVCPLRENFFSGDDIHVHRTVFPRAYSIALVVTLAEDGVVYSMFGWRDGLVKPRAFHVLEKGAN